MQNTTWKRCIESSSCWYGVPLFCLLPYVSPVKWWPLLFGLSVSCLHLDTPSDASEGPRQIFHLGYGHGHPCSPGPSAYPVWAPLVVLVGVELGVVLEGHVLYLLHISFAPCICLWTPCFDLSDVMKTVKRNSCWLHTTRIKLILDCFPLISRPRCLELSNELFCNVGSGIKFVL
jgi:hypothetical protein